MALLLANGADPEMGPIHITADAPVIHAACFKRTGPVVEPAQGEHELGGQP
ncbi:hypothetical protein OROMI_001029 [Orobanche minor]